MRVTSTVLPLLGFAGVAGVQVEALLGAANLDSALFAGPDIHLLHSQELRLWGEAARMSGDDDFGLHLAEWVAPRSEELFDILCFALRSSPTLGDHYRRVARYMRLVHPGVRVSLEEEARVARLVHSHRREPALPSRQPVEAFFALALLLGRRAVGEEFTPREVCFRHARPARVREHERLFGAPVRFGCPRDELVVDGAHLERKPLHAEPLLLALLDRQLDGMLAIQPERDGLLELVQSAMRDELPDREPSVASVAAKRHMSPRSLQRRLREEGTTFAELLEELRRDLALRYLRDPRIGIAEVGFLLGFRDVTAFHRAFRRWTGTTPASYRRSAGSS